MKIEIKRTKELKLKQKKNIEKKYPNNINFSSFFFPSILGCYYAIQTINKRKHNMV